jgi:AmiR/NasT family two-component response regulator
LTDCVPLVIDTDPAALTAAMTERDVIGQAQGVRMERDQSTAGEAFDALARCAQMLDVQVGSVAAALVRTTSDH